jgi:hypothetical protein
MICTERFQLPSDEQAVPEEQFEYMALRTFTKIKPHEWVQ